MSSSPLVDNLATQVASLWRRKQAPLLLAISGMQGSGKSTLSQHLIEQLYGDNITGVAVSLDDFYFDANERAQLAQRVHPLYRQRGLPGSHDLALLQQVLWDFKQQRALLLPVFDKASDNKLSKSQWRPVPEGAQVLIVEGWCMGVTAQPAAQLGYDVNDFERKHDHDGRFRHCVNRLLATNYHEVFEQFDGLVFLNGQSFSRVYRWRLQQEHALRAQTGKGMTDEEVLAFIQPFQRLSEWAVTSLSESANVVVDLGEDREVLTVRGQL